MAHDASLTAHPIFDGITLAKAGPAPHKYAVHSHEAYSIICLTGGSKLFSHCGREQQVDAGQIAIANPGDHHGCGPLNGQPWSHRTWYLSEMAAMEVAGSLSASPRLQAPVIASETVWAALVNAHKMAETGERLEAQSAAIDALSRLFDEFALGEDLGGETDVSTAQIRVAGCIDAFQRDPSRTPDLQELSASCAVSRVQVIRDFKLVLGVTPGVYFRNERLKLAKGLMRSGDGLADIAAHVGFADQSHFTRAFRDAFGVTPRAYMDALARSGGSAPL
jgi:AraC-like DNA-binding protein